MGVQADIFKNRLFQVRRTKKRVTVCDEVPLTCESLNHRDAFILDAGLNLWVWFGDDCNPFVKQNCNTRAKNIESSRTGCYEVHHASNEPTEDPDEPDFWALLGGKGDIAPAESVDDDEEPDFGDGVLFSVTIDDDRNLA